jgi:hypothetical protein
MHNRDGGEPDLDRIRQSHCDSKTFEAAQSFVMKGLQALPEGCLHEFRLGIDPSEFLDAFTERGAPTQLQKIARGSWMLLIQPPGERKLMELCDLESPIPMERILEAVAQLRPGEALIAHTPCFPRPLLAELDRRGLDWEAAEAADTTGLIWVGKPD